MSRRTDKVPGRAVPGNSDSQTVAKYPQISAPGPPRSGLETDPSQHPNLELNLGSLLVDPFHNPIVHKLCLRGEFRRRGGLVPRILIERRHAGLRKRLRLVENLGVNVLVVEGYLLVRVPRRELKLPVRGDMVVREIEVGNRQRIGPELGYAGAEDEPDDEEHRANDDEQSDDHCEDAAEKYGSPDGIGVRLLVVGVVVIVVVVGAGRRSCISVGGAGRWWPVRVVAVGVCRCHAGGSWVAGNRWCSLIAHDRESSTTVQITGNGLNRVWQCRAHPTRG